MCSILSLQGHLKCRIKYENLSTDHFTMKYKHEDKNLKQKCIKAIFAKVA